MSLTKSSITYSRIGATRQPGGDWEFVLWAPKARTCSVVFQGKGEVLNMEAFGRGYYRAVASFEPNSQYFYRLDDSQDLPDPENRVTLDGEGKIVLAYTPNNGEGHRRLVAKVEHLMQQQSSCPIHGRDCHQGLFSRNLFLGQRIPLAGVAHQNGTIRFGDDPAMSALDRNCRAHGVDNLYVVDGSFFPSSGAVNPALTIMANALRVGDHILERLGARATASTASASVAGTRSGIAAGAIT